MPNLEGFMPINVVLAVGLDSWLLENQRTAWKSAGYFVISAESVKEAISHFKAGDFDLVLLGHSIPVETRERLTFLIRSTGSRTPVVCIGDSCSDCNSFADATFENDPNQLLTGIGELLATKARMRATQAAQYGNASRGAAAQR